MKCKSCGWTLETLPVPKEGEVIEFKCDCPDLDPVYEMHKELGRLMVDIIRKNYGKSDD